MVYYIVINEHEWCVSVVLCASVCLYQAGLSFFHTFVNTQYQNMVKTWVFSCQLMIACSAEGGATVLMNNAAGALIAPPAFSCLSSRSEGRELRWRWCVIVSGCSSLSAVYWCAGSSSCHTAVSEQLIGWELSVCPLQRDKDTEQNVSRTHRPDLN